MFWPNGVCGGAVVSVHRINAINSTRYFGFVSCSQSHFNSSPNWYKSVPGQAFLFCIFESCVCVCDREWIIIFIFIFFHLTVSIKQPYLRALTIPHFKWKLTIRYTWNVSFFGVAIVFLCIYQRFYLADNLYFKQNGQNYYRSYENLLFYTSTNQQHQRCSPFNGINLLLLSFYIVDALYNLNERNYAEAINKFLACSILICFEQSRWDGVKDSERERESGEREGIYVWFDAVFVCIFLVDTEIATWINDDARILYYLLSFLMLVCFCLPLFLAWQIGILFGDIQHSIQFHQFGGWHVSACVLAYDHRTECDASSNMCGHQTPCMVVHLLEFIAIQVSDTDTVRTKIPFGTELFAVALVRLIGVEFGKHFLATSHYYTDDENNQKY